MITLQEGMRLIRAAELDHRGRLAEIELEAAAAQAGGIPARRAVRVEDLAKSVTTITPCRVCSLPFMAFVDPRQCAPTSCGRQHSMWDATPAGRAANSACPRPDKIGWQTVREARDVLDAMRGPGVSRSAHLRAYVCRCGAFHVGNVQKERREAGE